MRKNLAVWIKQKFKEQKFFFVTPDVGHGMWEPIKAALGPYAVNLGITEPHSVDFAAGLAAQEKVFLYSIAGFVGLRGLEQIKLSLAHDQNQVCLIGSGGNFYYGLQGVTHYASEDLALIANYPSIRIFYPHTPEEFDYFASTFLADGRPSFMRLDPHPVLAQARPKTVDGHTIFYYQQSPHPTAFIVVAGTHSLTQLLTPPAIHLSSEILTAGCWDEAYLTAIAQAYLDAQQRAPDAFLPFIIISEVGPLDPLASRMQHILHQLNLDDIKIHSLHYGDGTANLHLGPEEYLVAQLGLGRTQIAGFLQQILNP